MLNREKFMDEIIKFALGSDSLAVKDGKPVSCGSLLNCDECDLHACAKNCKNCRENAKE